MGYYGLAACMATAWDSMCSPVDVRGLTPSQVRSDAAGLWFALGRAKTGRAAAATLSPWSEAILRAYVAKAGRRHRAERADLREPLRTCLQQGYLGR